MDLCSAVTLVDQRGISWAVESVAMTALSLADWWAECLVDVWVAWSDYETGAQLVASTADCSEVW